MLAHELHDSLAQTVASQRYQSKMLDDTLQEGDITKARKENARIKASIDEAHTELRQLLYHFRAPLDGRGLVPTLQEIVERFRKETAMAIFLQHQCDGSGLPAIMEMQVLRIIQESLANIRKHSQAQHVRVLLSCTERGAYRALIEDDGVGIGQVLGGDPGEHVGLSIMQERAQRLGGTLHIESEPGEGTRVELKFNYVPNELDNALPALQVASEHDARPHH
jgi:two-component system nitrate/nitrite sensor histidine kinase NarX